MNKKILKSVMALHGDTQSDLAGALGLSSQSLCYKMNGKRPFTQPEISAIIKRYRLTSEQLNDIFFAW